MKSTTTQFLDKAARAIAAAERELAVGDEEALAPADAAEMTKQAQAFLSAAHRYLQQA